MNVRLFGSYTESVSDKCLRHYATICATWTTVLSVPLHIHKIKTAMGVHTPHGNTAVRFFSLNFLSLTPTLDGF